MATFILWRNSEIFSGLTKPHSRIENLWLRLIIEHNFAIVVVWTVFGLNSSIPSWIESGRFKPLMLQLDSVQIESLNNSISTLKVEYNSSPETGYRRILP